MEMLATPSLSLDLLNTISLYIHIPFCHKKCHYCDFNSYSGMLGWRTRYVQALRREIALVGQAARMVDGTRRRCRTIFFGGGTPSLLSAAEVQSILDTAHEVFAVDGDAEITLEANPGTLEYGHLADLRSTGVNRLSIGAQSFDADLLRWMGRIHSPEEIITAVHEARAAGFDRLNLDFIFALPEQSVAQWQETVERALELQPDHLSFYSLIVEPETPLFDWVEAGQVHPAEDDLAADMYEWAEERLAQAGYGQYEISNWSTLGQESRHNLTYWHNLPYLGVGAGAHSSFGGRRFSNLKPIAEYVAALRGETWQPDIMSLGTIGGPIAESESVDIALERAQTVILALRLNEGLDLDHFHARYGASFSEMLGSRIADLVTPGLVEYVTLPDGGHRLRLTDRGRLVGNEVFGRFID